MSTDDKNGERNYTTGSHTECALQSRAVMPVLRLPVMATLHRPGTDHCLVRCSPRPGSSCRRAQRQGSAARPALATCMRKTRSGTAPGACVCWSTNTNAWPDTLDQTEVAWPSSFSFHVTTPRANASRHTKGVITTAYVSTPQVPTESTHATPT